MSAMLYRGNKMINLLTAIAMLICFATVGALIALAFI
jgi:hypothetical protein